MGRASRTTRKELQNLFVTQWCTQTSMSIKTLNSREVYRNPWLRMREDKIERSNGVHGINSVVGKDDCAIILPIQGNTAWPSPAHR